MPVEIKSSVTSVVMNDPALRVVDKSFCADRKVSKASARALEKYENSRVVLPSIWGRKSLSHPKHLDPFYGFGVS